MLVECGSGAFRKAAEVLSILMTAKKRCGISQDVRVSVEASRRYHAVVGLGEHRLVGRCGRVEPIAELESPSHNPVGESRDSMRRTWATIESN